MQNIRNFCIIAHIDAGKSTLADRFLELTGTVEKRNMQEQFLDTMELERERGITIKLQPVRMNYQDYIFNLIDTPGHVDFTYEVSRSLAAVEGAILLVDATKGVQAQTLANLHLAQKQHLTITPVINKIDLPNARVAEAEEEILNLLPIERADILKVSAKTGEGIEQILQVIIEQIPPPKTYNLTPSTLVSRALIFDSAFDTYKGVIAYVRVFDGQFKAGQKIKLAASGASEQLIEVGYFTPQLKKSDVLSVGEIGYLATGLKDPGQVRVGDTIFNLEPKTYNLKPDPLPGYQEPQPVVFASFYPENGDDYDLLKDALSKLKLTDASLTYEPESSPALGRGFRLGFLGMLHTEIISERLRREFKLSLIISAPSVEYHIKLKAKNEKLKIRSAAQLPDAGQIEEIEEPVVDLEILSPASYLGSLMKLLGELRNQYLATDYLTKEIVILKYRVPLAEIVTDFYNQLKSVTSGYASMSYEPTGYQVSALVRLDILVAGDLVEPFSRMVPRSEAYDQGKEIVEKLKGIIPKQLFAVSLQAAIGGKIIARETISAMRKDVTGYLYGGDVTRKKKLLEKQKRGKARMKESGRVEIPQSVFLEMLKK
ncbi:MAG: translation elongation factor 4 [Patescibacteria group bacterium]|mgnify:FL=1